VSTLSIGAFAAEDEPVAFVFADVGGFDFDASVVDDDELLVEVEVVADVLSSVPLIVTLCPTCAVSLLSSASSLYVVPAVPLEVLDPAVPVVPAPAVPVAEPVPRIAFVRMNEPLVPVLDALPDVPVALCAGAR